MAGRDGMVAVSLRQIQTRRLTPANPAIRTQDFTNEVHGYLINMGSNRCSARAVEGCQEATFGADCEFCFDMIERAGEFVAIGIIAAYGHADSALSHCGEHLLEPQGRSFGFITAEAFETGAGEESGIHLTLAELFQPRINISAQGNDFEIGAGMEQLRLPPQAGRADHHAFGQGVQLRLPARCEQHIARIFTLQDCRHDQARRQLCRHILHRMHSEDRFAGELGLVNFLCEQALAACFQKRAILDLVPGRNEAEYREGRVAMRRINAMSLGKTGLDQPGLNKGQRGFAGSDRERFGQIWHVAAIGIEGYRTIMDLPFPTPAKQDGPLTVIGLESSCDESAVAILRRNATGGVDILADLVLSQTDQHAPFGGVVPEIAARAHAEAMDGLVAAALEQAGLDLSELDAIAATAGPGLIGGVMAALMTAKGLALGAGKPLIAVNHLEGHALSPRLGEAVEFPYLLLLVSGGHTQLLIAEGVGVYHRLGSTLDDAAGEAFDKTAKVMGLGFPGGPALEKIAAGGDAARFALPTPLKGRPGCDFSFAGLKTAARQIWDGLEAPSDQDKADLAASVQSAIAKALASRTSRAMAAFIERYPEMAAPRPLIVAGGVAANKTVRAALQATAGEHGFRLIAPPSKWCTDNAAMIALAGLERLERGQTDPLAAPARARWPLDESSAKLDPAIGSGRKGPKA